MDFFHLVACFKWNNLH